MKQNNLTLYTWVDVHIGGEQPMYIIGKITNIEEDCIEIKTVQPSEGIIYIDFEYKGIQNIFRLKPSLFVNHWIHLKKQKKYKKKE